MLVGLLLFVVAAVGMLVAARRAGRLGTAAKVSLVLAAVGVAMLIAATGVQSLFFGGDWSFMPYFVIPAVLLLVLGLITLGVSVLRSGVLPRWGAIALVVGTAAMLPFNEQTHAAWFGVLFGLGWMAVGVSLLLHDRRSAGDAAA